MNTDRLQRLMAQRRVTGIDFVYVHNKPVQGKVQLDVHFLRHPATLEIPLVGDLNRSQIRIYNPYGGHLQQMTVHEAEWVTEEKLSILGAELDKAGLGPLNPFPGTKLPNTVGPKGSWTWRQIVLDTSSGRFYWTNPAKHRIEYYDPVSNLVKTLVGNLAAPLGVAIDTTSGRIYWTDPAAHLIQCADLHGQHVREVVVDCDAPMSIVIDKNRLYWTDASLGEISSADLDGRKVKKGLVHGLQSPYGLAVDSTAGMLYWTDPGAKCIQRAKTTGTGGIKTLLDGLQYPLCMALDIPNTGPIPGLSNKKIYWTDPESGQILRMSTNGGSVERFRREDKSLPYGLCLDSRARRIYWTPIAEKEILRLKTDLPTDNSLYRLYIGDNRIDPFYNDVPVNFKAGCESDLDCETQEPECPPETLVDFPVNYLARDFHSFRRALLDFASLRYPHWQDRLEADAGIMLVEVMSALADEMAYYQDRISREAYLETATQRRSLRHHARLVDYHIHDGLGATGWVDVTVNEKLKKGIIPPGTAVWAISDNGDYINYEIGYGLAETLRYKENQENLPKHAVAVNFQWNEFDPHIWDEDERCLPRGTTVIHVVRRYKDRVPFDDLPFDDLPEDKAPGKWVLLQTTPANPAQPARAHLVRVIKIANTIDPVSNENITRLEWEQEQALPFDLDMTVLKVRGNILPVSAGITREAFFITGADSSAFSQTHWETLRQANVQRAVERRGRDGAITYLFSMAGSDEKPIVRLGKDPRDAVPEIFLQEMAFNDQGELERVENWEVKRSLIGVNSSLPEDLHFTLEDGIWAPVVTYQRSGETFQFADYISDKGMSIRFGDGEFGKIPAEKSIFKVYYRLGGGLRSNVAAQTLVYLSPPPDFKTKVCTPSTSPNLGFVEAVCNPLPTAGGLDAETPDAVRQLAPEAFRAIAYRAVRPEDYAEAAERLPWVQRAGATMRWTGSWLTTFVTPDPYQSASLSETQRFALEQHLDRFRQCGREVHVLGPEYADLDIYIYLCVQHNAYGGEVKKRVLEVLLGKTGIRPQPGYFSPDHFTFGTALDRSTLEAAIQNVPGVRAVEQIQYRRRGWFTRKTLEFSYDPGKNSIIRVDNDPQHPERGTVHIYLHGGL